MAKILVAEDDAALLSLVGKYLEENGHEAKLAKNGEEAFSAFYEGHFDMILSDIMMPQMDGFTLAENVRREDKLIPILFMSAKDDKPSKMYAYKIGIDDYVTKPFDVDVLMLKIEALMRRAGIERSKEITIGNFSMNIEERCALVDGEEIALTAREFDLLFKLLSNLKKTFTRSVLMEEFWDYDSSATSRTVDVYMAKLREKTSHCDGFEILTVHGLGYKAVMK